ncbi:2-dehydro-3-deoxygalactonokinase [Sphingomonas baiyangensis]|uniref:2-dehydro-3-deoxygalactonokinase n=1 Tax=Sphingomonas baiyangensis TaxID=2572576 RepID=A0A4U1L4K8_9SPHN|nr:2-dehydro-3-deoxygalactonokinase [Sphingomonas baiyangensis]TKD51839.1 2-dehydro-3-deoxygalactonokinase [Sphingomonas baiyangensis]
MSDGRFIAIDWGTTNRRAWLIERGQVLAAHRDDRGVRAMASADYPAAIAELRARFGDIRVLAAGMVGSSRGWREAPYVPCPAGAAELAAQLLEVERDVWIVPGVSHLGEGRADVMRGEEVQLIGAVAAGLAPHDGLLVQPGTHSKWAWMQGGRIARFATAMTGELFDLLRRHSILAEMMRETPDPDSDAFALGVARGAAGESLLHALFDVRAGTLLGLRDASAGASLASGLLIGAEIAAHRADMAGGVHLLAEGPLAAAYARAIALSVATAHVVDSEAAFVAGISMIEEMRR